MRANYVAMNAWARIRRGIGQRACYRSGVDQFDVDAAILHPFDAGDNLDQLASQNESALPWRNARLAVRVFGSCPATTLHFIESVSIKIKRF